VQIDWVPASLSATPWNATKPTWKSDNQHTTSLSRIKTNNYVYRRDNHSGKTMNGD